MRRALLLLACLPLLLTCRGRETRGPAPVILISIDTLRSDHLPAYGYRAIATPALDAFRRDAILYERAYSHVPLTLPSHATIFTGLRPAQHGIRDNTGFRLRVPASALLAAKMKQRGYATGAAVSAYVLRAETGIAQGFDTFDDEIDRGAADQSLGAVQRPGPKTIASAQSWLGAHGSTPFFYFLHLYEPHAPYDAPEPYRSRAARPYDAEIEYTDALLGGFFAFLKERGLYDRALIVVLSDHGEGLGDHDEDEHGIFLYREALQVPLLVKLPSGARGGTVIHTPASWTPKHAYRHGACTSYSSTGISCHARHVQAKSRLATHTYALRSSVAGKCSVSQRFAPVRAMMLWWSANREKSTRSAASGPAMPRGARPTAP